MFIICLLLFGAFCQKTLASFDGPKEVLVCSWGNKDFEMGLEITQYGLVGGGLIGVGKDGLLVVGDGVNRRIKVYSQNGQWIRNIEPQGVILSPLGGWPSNLKVGDGGLLTLKKKYQKYGLDGSLIFSIEQKGYKDFWFGTAGEVYLETPYKKFQKYSPSGELLATYDNKPLVLGVKVSERRMGDFYQTTIQYDDITYSLTSDEPIEDYVRDQSGYLYATVHYYLDKPNNIWTNRVVKYGHCGKALGRWDRPLGAFREFPTDPNAPPPPTSQIEVIEEYGPPVIGPDGSVYAYKRTPDSYSILKWAWVDSPDDPQPGPDAPSELTVQPSIDGLYLTWGASPQDPGCVDGYEVERSTSAGGIYTSVKTTDPGVLKFNDTGALPGSTYFYKVRAKSGSTYSPYTAEMSGTR
jgi:hypothetical protein